MNLISIQNINLAWKQTDKHNLVLNGGKDGKFIIIKAPVFTKRPPGNDSASNLDFFHEWNSQSANSNFQVNKKVHEKLDMFIPHILHVYEPDLTNINKFTCLSANEIESKLPGVIIKATFHIKNNMFNRGEDAYQSFSAILNQMIIWATKTDKLTTTIFDNHNPNSGPMILSPACPKCRAENCEGVNTTAGPSNHSIKSCKLSDNTTPKNTIAM
ncbi:hypothetical protein FRB94_012191 [Tulasnella sp. JGI-2019a]|nr:hypothetical protein FRB93_011026 [Tulasnella sp. JGI-2019a]KAG8991887.1 hypothetical protein FRB94_012191 [Tulasnella sp. JGI-2019a]KAG9023857.1 hypothetical protein FRB95_012399 [Tulasnella sp. JGI-2019a]